MASDFLLEIGTEEIPASYIQPALDAMAAMLQKTLTDKRVVHGAIQTMATPRRLAWRIEGVAEKQEPQTVEITGPPKATAFDESGHPKAAGLPRGCEGMRSYVLGHVRTRRRQGGDPDP